MQRFFGEQRYGFLESNGTAGIAVVHKKMALGRNLPSAIWLPKTGRI